MAAGRPGQICAGVEWNPKMLGCIWEEELKQQRFRRET